MMPLRVAGVARMAIVSRHDESRMCEWRKVWKGEVMKQP
jgi:hypothetical protein